MDNVSIHHVDTVVELLTSVGALVRFLPTYSPDINPIEVFAEVKYYLQANSRLFDSFMTPTTIIIILQAFNSVSTENSQSYIKNAGYFSLT